LKEHRAAVGWRGFHVTPLKLRDGHGISLQEVLANACPEVAISALAGECARLPSGRALMVPLRSASVTDEMAWERPAAHRGPLAGREHEHAELGRTLAGLRAGQCQFLEISGEPGIGKTRMLIELTGSAHAGDIRVLAGRAPVPDRQRSYGPLVDALDDYLAGPARACLAEVRADFRDLLSAIFPSLSPRSAPAREGEPYQQVLAMRDLLEVLGARSPLVIVLDDLHWCDSQTIDLLAHVLRSRLRGAVMLAFSHRPRQSPARLRSVLDDAHGLTRLPLAPLSQAETAILAHPQWSAGQRALVHRHGGGNPRYLLALASSPQPDMAMSGDVELGAVLPSAEAALVAELETLSAAARLAAQAAAVIADSFGARAITEVAESGERLTQQAIDELVRRDIIRPEPGTGTFRFRHRLLRLAVYRGADSGWRLGAHARAAAVLTACHASATDRAPHLARTAMRGDTAAAEVLTEAAAAIRDSSPATAVAWLRAALRLCADQWPAEVRSCVRVALADALDSAGRPRESLELLHDELTGPGTGSGAGGERRTRAVLHYAQIQRHFRRPREVSSLIASERERDGVPRSAPGALLSLELACADLARSRLAECRALARHAAEVSVLHDWPGSHCAALAVLSLADSFSGATQTGAQLAARAGHELDGLEDGELAAWPDIALWAGLSEMYAERLRDSARHLTRAVQAGRTARRPLVELHALIGRALAMRLTGCLPQAVQSADEAVDLAAMVGSDELHMAAATSAWWARTWAGDIRGGTLHDAMAGLPSGSDWLATASRGMLAEVKLATGDAAGCRILLTEAGPGLPAADPWTQVGWYEMLVRVAVGTGDHDHADEWAGRAEAAARKLMLPGRAGLAALARAQALAAADPAISAAMALRAAESLAACGMVLEAGRAQAAAGWALLACDEHDQAWEAAKAALEIFDDCGAGQLSKQVSLLRRRLVSTAPRANRLVQGVAALSRRQRQVAALVSEGLTNRQIAARLFVTDKTVEMHLSQVFEKLGVFNRVGVVRELSRVSQL
jgi:DNA-binding NarL/FixJ family response regulator